MLIVAKSNRFFIEKPSFSNSADLQTGYGGFYQQAVSELIKCAHTKQLLREMGDRLVMLAEQAYTFRRADTLELVSLMLSNLPQFQEYKPVGSYYRALSIQRFGRGNIKESARILERVSEDAPLRYRLKAIVSLGANRFLEADYQSALSLYHDAGCFASYHDLYDAHPIVHAQRMIAVINSLEGNHRDAVMMLENLFPLAHSMRSIHPQVYYDYLNSFAVELGEVGRIEEARNICQIVLASPFASAYPEWRETGDELALRGYHTPRSFVSLTQRALKPDNVLPMSLPEYGNPTGSEKHSRSPFQQKATVTSLRDWKQKMGKEPNGNQKNDKSPQELDGRKMLLKIVEISTTSGLPDEALREMLDALEKIASKYTKEKDKKD